jgi:hypothetical protein
MLIVRRWNCSMDACRCLSLEAIRTMRVVICSLRASVVFRGLVPGWSVDAMYRQGFVLKESRMQE